MRFEDWEWVINLLRKLPGGASLEELIERLMREHGWDRARALRAIEAAQAQGKVIVEDGRVSLKVAPGATERPVPDPRP
jgi:hypothetical protein